METTIKTNLPLEIELLPVDVMERAEERNVARPIPTGICPWKNCGIQTFEGEKFCFQHRLGTRIHRAKSKR